MDDQNHILYSNRAAAYCKKEKWIDAVVDGEKVTQLKPTWAKGWARLGTAHFGGKDYIGARRAYDKALELDPDNEDYKTFVAKSKESAETAVDAQKAAVPELLIKFCEEVRRIDRTTCGPHHRHPCSRARTLAHSVNSPSIC